MSNGNKNYELTMLTISTFLVYLGVLGNEVIAELTTYDLAGGYTMFLGLAFFAFWVISKIFIKPISLGSLMFIGFGVIFLNTFILGIIGELTKGGDGMYLTTYTGFLIFIGIAFLVITPILYGLNKLIKRGD